LRINTRSRAAPEGAQSLSLERSAFSVTAIQEIAPGFIGMFKVFPPRQKPAKFNVEDVMAQMYKTGAN
jgi:hypothetical protein